MQKLISLFFLIGLSAFVLKVNGQTHLPPVYKIKSNIAIYANIENKYWQLLEDPSGKLTIDQVSIPDYNSKFHVNTTNQKGYNYDATMNT
jgi:hypothetical protein